jgi:hypothetical protein
MRILYPLRGRWQKAPDEVCDNECPPHQAAAHTSSPQGEALKNPQQISTFWRNKENSKNKYLEFCKYA